MIINAFRLKFYLPKYESVGVVLLELVAELLQHLIEPAHIAHTHSWSG